MGATCSSCCWSERRVDDVLPGSSLQDKLLDTAGDYDNNSTILDESPSNPFARSESRMKESWPRPETSPTSVRTDNEHDDDDSDDYSEHGSDRQSSMSAQSDHAWNLRTTEHATSSFANVDTLNGEDDDADNALRSARAISATQSVRSASSDSYASTRHLTTYESQLFSDDPRASQASRTSTDCDNSDDDDGDDDDDSRDTSLSSLAPSRSSVATTQGK